MKPTGELVASKQQRQSLITLRVSWRTARVQEIIPKRSPRNSSQGLVRRRAYLHCEPITNADANCEIGSQTGTRPGKNHIPERQGKSRSRYPILPRMSSKGSGRGEPRHHQQAKSLRRKTSHSKEPLRGRARRDGSKVRGHTLTCLQGD